MSAFPETSGNDAQKCLELARSRPEPRTDLPTRTVLSISRAALAPAAEQDQELRDKEPDHNDVSGNVILGYD